MFDPTDRVKNIETSPDHILSVRLLLPQRSRIEEHDVGGALLLILDGEHRTYTDTQGDHLHLENVTVLPEQAGKGIGKRSRSPNH